VVQYKTHVPPVIATLLVSRTFQIYNNPRLPLGDNPEHIPFLDFFVHDPTTRKTKHKRKYFVKVEKKRHGRFNDVAEAANAADPFLEKSRADDKLQALGALLAHHHEFIRDAKINHVPGNPTFARSLENQVQRSTLHLASKN
jgi:hypothetical protein